jgi:hypothetical protein
MTEIFRRQNQRTFLAKFHSASLLGALLVFDRALVNESEMITALMGMNGILQNCCCAWDALYDTTP